MKKILIASGPSSMAPRIVATIPTMISTGLSRPDNTSDAIPTAISATATIAAWRAGLEERAVRQAIGCLLARAAGRSQLEYLSADEKARQRDLALDLIDDRPMTIPAFVDAWEAAAA